jgi:hypothetical protein
MVGFEEQLEDVFSEDVYDSLHFKKVYCGIMESA